MPLARASRVQQGLTISLLAHALLLLAASLLLNERTTPPVPIEPSVALEFTRPDHSAAISATDPLESVLHQLPPPIVARSAAPPLHVPRPAAAQQVPVQQAAAAAPVAGTAARPVTGMESDLPPTYPETARRRGQQGRVVVRVNVSADGRPLSVSIEQGSGYASLDEAAVNAVEHWRFVPATRDGASVPATAEVPIRFKLVD